MAFENAIITKEDDEKYGLSKIYYKYNPKREVFINKQDWVKTESLIVGYGISFISPIPNMNMELLLKLFGFYIIKVKLLKLSLIMTSTER